MIANPKHERAAGLGKVGGISVSFPALEKAIAEANADAKQENLLAGKECLICGILILKTKSPKFAMELDKGFVCAGCQDTIITAWRESAGVE